jgi:hypothetical protein
MNLMKFSRAISWVKWLSGEKNNVLKTISVLVLMVYLFPVKVDEMRFVAFLVTEYDEVFLGYQPG